MCPWIRVVFCWAVLSSSLTKHFVRFIYVFVEICLLYPFLDKFRLPFSKSVNYFQSMSSILFWNFVLFTNLIHIQAIRAINTEMVRDPFTDYRMIRLTYNYIKTIATTTINVENESKNNRIIIKYFFRFLELIY